MPYGEKFNFYGNGNYFLSIWKTDNISTGSSADNQISLPLSSTGEYNFTVVWGDGQKNTITAYNQAEVTHTYSSIGTYAIEITGTCKGWVFNNTGDRLKLLNISKWGNLKLGSSGYYFYGCNNLNITATDKLRGSTDLIGVFRECTILNSYLNIDDTNVTSYVRFLSNCTAYNQALTSINTSKASSFGYMFYYATAFNQDISHFDSRNVLSMTRMFTGCTAFNQDISNLSLLNVTDMSFIFTGATAWSTTNYDLFLIGTYNQAITTGVQNGVLFTCVTKYTLGGAAEAARTYLQNIKSWTINDSGGV